MTQKSPSFFCCCKVPLSFFVGNKELIFRNLQQAVAKRTFKETCFQKGNDLIFHCSQVLLLRGFDTENYVQQIIFDVLLGLEHLHNHQVFPNKLTSQNIIFDKSGRAQITDFIPYDSIAFRKSRKFRNINSVGN